MSSSNWGELLEDQAADDKFTLSGTWRELCTHGSLLLASNVSARPPVPALMTSFLGKYFMAWKLGEAAAVSFGYGYNKQTGAWSGCQNIDLYQWLTGQNISICSKAWNQKTQVRTCLGFSANA